MNIFSPKQIVFLVSITFFVGCHPQPSEQLTSQGVQSTTNSKVEGQHLIRIGDKIEAARKTLDDFGKKNSVGGFAFRKGPEDIENIFIQLDPNHMNACAWYSKSTGKITRLSIVCFPGRRSARVTHVWIPVKAIKLKADGTHDVTFQKPLTSAELDAREKEAMNNRPKSSRPFGN